MPDQQQSWYIENVCFINGKMLSWIHKVFQNFALASPGEVIWIKFARKVSLDSFLPLRRKMNRIE